VRLRRRWESAPLPVGPEGDLPRSFGIDTVAFGPQPVDGECLQRLCPLDVRNRIEAFHQVEPEPGIRSALEQGATLALAHRLEDGAGKVAATVTLAAPFKMVLKTPRRRLAGFTDVETAATLRQPRGHFPVPLRCYLDHINRSQGTPLIDLTGYGSRPRRHF
jgi:hypothetical protein